MKNLMHIKNLIKKGLMWYLFSFLVYSIVYTTFYFSIGNIYYSIIGCVFFVFNAIVLFNIKKLSYDITVYFIKLYLYVLLVLCFLSVFFVIFNIYYCILWYIILLGNVYVFLEKNEFKFWVYLVFGVLVINAAGLYFILHNNIIDPHLLFKLRYPYITESNKVYTESIVLGFFCVNIYFLLKFNNYKTEITLLSKAQAHIEKIPSEADKENEKMPPKEDYKTLFTELNQLMESNELYLDKEISISKLAEILDTNSTYISKAINQNFGGNFNDFINSYRIKHFKKLVSKNENDTFKLLYLYHESGFKNQSTFNKVFKKIEGMTPTEYIRNLS